MLAASVESFGGTEVDVLRNRLVTPDVNESLDDCDEGGRGNSTWKLDEGLDEAAPESPINSTLYENAGEIFYKHTSVGCAWWGSRWFWSCSYYRYNG
jgi:hypothetical protein